MSRLPPPVKVRIAYPDKLAFKLILFLRWLFREQFLLQRWFKRVHRRILAQVRAQQLGPDQLVQPVPTVRLDQITPGSFFHEHLRAGLPIIIKGGALATKAYEEWSVEGFERRFPAIKLKMVDLDSGEYLQATLGQLLDSRTHGPRLYVRNTANLVSDHPELVDELGVLDFRPQGRGPRLFFTGVQLFIGVHRGSGTDFHCALNVNLNYQLRGRKKWYFVHPEHSWFMYPLVNDHMMFVGSFLPVGKESMVERHFPLFRYCPRMEAVVEPGDILLNPPYYWHGIESLDDVSVSASTRWFGQRLPRANLFFDGLNLLSLHAWRLKWYSITAPPDQLPLMRDEGNMKLGGNNEDYTSFGKQSGKNLFDPMNWSAEDRFDDASSST